MDAALRALGEEALEAHPGDAKKATNWMINQLLHNEVFFQQHVVPLVTAACDGVIRYINTQRRVEVRRHVSHVIELSTSPSAMPEPKAIRRKEDVPRITQEVPPTDRLLRAQQMAMHSYLNDYMVGHKLLGDCTRPELLKAATAHLKSGRTQTVNGYFFASIAHKMNDDKKKVRDVLTDSDLAKMREVADAKVA